MTSSIRLGAAARKIRRVFTLGGLRKLVTRPSIVVQNIRILLFDVTLKPIPLTEQLKTANNTLNALAETASLAGHDFPTEDIAATGSASAEDPDTAELGELFKKWGSDKSTKHNYHIIYSAILRAKRTEPLTMLEIGLGTNRIDTLSNMGLQGRPGASLRAFREWLPNSRICGADVDKRILFSEERIETYFVDQTDRAALRNLAGQFSPGSFDLIIDDGLHNSEANTNTLLFALPLLKATGVFVIEDIMGTDQPVWQAAFGLLDAKYHCEFVKTRSAYVVVISSKTAGNRISLR